MIFYFTGTGNSLYAASAIAEAQGKALAASGIVLNSSFALRMPNNYVVGFDVDPKELEERKLKEAEEKLQEINGIISRTESAHRNIPGSFPGLKTRVVNPLFNRFAMDTKKFYADDKCTSCSLCEKVCPVHTITVEGKPVWGKVCTQCLACIHRCPVRAIQMGKRTENKGRYLHPDLGQLEKQQHALK